MRKNKAKQVFRFRKQIGSSQSKGIGDLCEKDKGINYIMMERNQNFGGGHVAYSDVKL